MAQVLSFVSAAFSFLLIVVPVILIHEFAHFLVGKWLGAKPEVFSIGFGKALYSFNFLDAEFRVSLIPLGGYVRFEKVQFEYERQISNKEDATPLGAWRWVLIALAGPVSNICLTFLIAAAMLYKDLGLVTVQNLKATSAVYSVSPTSKSFLLRKICGSTCPSAILYQNGHFKALNDSSLASLGISTGRRPLTGAERALYSFVVAGHTTQFLAEITVSGIKDALTTSSGYKNLSGPVGIATMSNEAVHDSLMAFLCLTGMVSFSVGFFNLLPLGVLDGGRVTLGLCEMIFRKPVTRFYAIPFQIISLGLLGILLLTSFASDFIRILGL